MSIYKWKSILFCSLIGAGLCLVSNAAADEWEDKTQYYEDDAWYDISEWFDGNDYNPTDESFGVWDNETYDFASESGDDFDNDPDYDDLDNDDDNLFGYNDSVYDYYDYDYYDDRDGNSELYDSYASDYADDSYSWYGYDDRYENDNWFYDYYDLGNGYYNDLNDDGIYDYSYNYYDYDGDGWYDSYYYYQDNDGDGTYDYDTYYTFSDVSDEEKEKSDSQKPQNSKRQRVSGKVANVKKVSVNDTKHCLVKLQGGEGKRGRYIDLGPAEKLTDFDIEEGDKISAQGPVIKVNDRRVLVAEKLTMNGNSQSITRNDHKVTGEVVDTKKMDIRGRSHLIAVIETNKNGRKRMVDLGAANRIEQSIEEGDKITVTGAPVKVKNKKLILAQTLTANGDSIEIDRREKQGRQSANRNASNSRR